MNSISMVTPQNNNNNSNDHDHDHDNNNNNNMIKKRAISSVYGGDRSTMTPKTSTITSGYTDSTVLASASGGGGSKSDMIKYRR
jgi:hypothetical protein